MTNEDPGIAAAQRLRDSIERPSTQEQARIAAAQALDASNDDEITVSRESWDKLLAERAHLEAEAAKARILAADLAKAQKANARQIGAAAEDRLLIGGKNGIHPDQLDIVVDATTIYGPDGLVAWIPVKLFRIPRPDKRRPRRTEWIQGTQMDVANIIAGQTFVNESYATYTAYDPRGNPRVVALKGMATIQVAHQSAKEIHAALDARRTRLSRGDDAFGTLDPVDILSEGAPFIPSETNERELNQDPFAVD